MTNYVTLRKIFLQFFFILISQNDSLSLYNSKSEVVMGKVEEKDSEVNLEKEIDYPYSSAKEVMLEVENNLIHRFTSNIVIHSDTIIQ